MNLQEFNEEILELLADREAEESIAEQRQLETAGYQETVSKPVFSSRVSEKAFDLIVKYESGGQAYYERVLKARPHWPKYRSGITLGFGYDLGYKTEAEFRSDWHMFDQSTLDRLAIAIGKHGGNADKQELEQITSQLEDIYISWSLAMEVFAATSLPKFIQHTDNALPNTHRLNGDCFGVLVSLTFNRGPYGYNKTGDRYRELNEIREELSIPRLSRVSDLLRSMIRVWQGTSIYKGMKRRREEEARLFDEGLLETSLDRGYVADFFDGDDPINESLSSQSLESSISDEDFWVDETEEDILEHAESPINSESFFETTSTSQVSWIKDDRESFDYSHLESSLPQNIDFSFRPSDLELLCRLNSFPVEELGDTPVLFGLRGASIYSGDSSEDGVLRDQVILKNIRPNHHEIRCVLGVWNKAENKIAVFPGSTVPSAYGVYKQYTKKLYANILPTGMYRYICGTHRTRSDPAGVPGSFLLRVSNDVKRTVVVRRSYNNLFYDLRDHIDPCKPGDNIHPTKHMSFNRLSSFGCQTIVGKGSPNGHSGPWANFRKAAGFVDVNGEPGKQFLYVLLTGQEALIASDLRRRGLDQDLLASHELQRLRFGSKGGGVEVLQRQLGAKSIDGDFGPTTARLLYRKQKAITNGRSDGIYSVKMDSALGWDVF